VSEEVKRKHLTKNMTVQLSTPYTDPECHSALQTDDTVSRQELLLLLQPGRRSLHFASTSLLVVPPTMPCLPGCCCTYVEWPAYGCHVCWDVVDIPPATENTSIKSLPRYFL